MIRLAAASRLGLAFAIVSLAAAAWPAAAAQKKMTTQSAKKVAARTDDKTDAAAGAPVMRDTYQNWVAYSTQGGKKLCYALASPKDRAPGRLKRDPAYVFISTRPGENVRNEVSIIMGFTVATGTTKKGKAIESTAEIGGEKFELVAKDASVWLKSPTKEPQFIDAMKRGEKLTVRAASAKGNVTTDTYMLAGLSKALDRVQKDCQ